MKTEAKEKVRLDKYLWSIRLFKTRSEAAAACESGKVRLAGSTVKAARTVGVGDEYEVRAEGRKWVIRVTALLQTRVAYPEAIKHYIDITPEDQVDVNKFQAASFHTGKRPSKIGRPTKKQRRDIEGFMGEGEGDEE
ncbi:RNA-binding S4 domain-containing protein [Flaviaesturariibacter flavus]|uniref:RNA-binding S4 domain-containing protein n=1 Tax=Flaviaesturariibacter flavus TaxID=2502780 RepID=UPI001FB40097|nr:RNA-binding S4 domain-containing protein [Flaviaesturariibacter flavus]